MGGRRGSMWQTMAIALVVIVFLNALAGSAGSPLERWLGIKRVPVWWPFVLAGVLGLIFGSVLNRRATPPGSGPQGRPGPRPSAIRGRHAVPRRVRRERERSARRHDRVPEARGAAPAPVPEPEAPPPPDGPASPMARLLSWFRPR